MDSDLMGPKRKRGDDERHGEQHARRGKTSRPALC